MQLRFLGQIYSTKSIQLATIPSDIPVHFRGQKYFLRRPLTALKPKFSIRQYRGILYTKS